METIRSSQVEAELDRLFEVTPQQVKQYREAGFIRLKHVLSPAVLKHYGQAITARVTELSVDAIPLEQRSTYGKAFLQVMNLWTKSPS